MEWAGHCGLVASLIRSWLHHLENPVRLRGEAIRHEPVMLSTAGISEPSETQRRESVSSASREALSQPSTVLAELEPVRCSPTPVAGARVSRYFGSTPTTNS